ncbi:MAG: serine--tRNA ligase [Bacteroidetes bacterium]|nr:serine--tRNA ligase [Bacteroidota bacterium]
MLQIQIIKEDKEKVIAGLKKKNFARLELIDEVIAIDEKRRSTQQELDSNLSEAKILAKQIGDLMKSGQKDEAEAMKAQTATLKETSKILEEKLSSLEEEQKQILLLIPNLPHSSVPFGKTPEENEVVLEHGTIPTLGANAVPHWELTAKYDIIDFELGNKITGAGFPVYKGKGARLQRALINFFLDEALKEGYYEIQPPILVNEDSGFGTGQLPDKEGQMYHMQVDNLYCIPTAEVPITNLYRDVILQEQDFPIKNVGYTPCFRREAGSYGAHVRGLNRLHQFDKVEIVHLSLPENSYETLEKMSLYVQGLLQKLELPYRVLRLCGGDMSFASALTYDMEVYSAAQQRWLEVSSVSNFESFQSNRLKLRYKKDGKTTLAHTLNGSALALPRIVAALLENNQTDEAILLPKVLHSYLGFDKI